MKKILYFYLSSCPYCRQASQWLDELMGEDPAYRAVEIERFEERRQPEIADLYDYYYVPTFYVDGVKLHEGACSREIVRSVLDAALEREARA